MPPIKTPAILPELAKFVQNHGSTDYAALMPAYHEAGFQVVLDETDAIGQNDSTVLVRFDVLVGRDYSYEKFTRLTVKVGTGPGPVSVAARRVAYDSLPYLIFGRFPPMPQPVEQPQPQQMNGHDMDEIDITMDDEDVVLPGERATWEPKPKLNLVARREPDGLPILRDLYEVGPPEVGSTGELVDAVVDFVRGFLDTASSPAQIDALASKNPDLATFVRDFGTDEQSAALLEAIGTRRRQLAAGVDAPRRRTPASAAN